MNQSQHKGQCHCGNVTLTIPYLTKTGTECNCSICSRYASVWGYFTDKEVDVEVGKYGISHYCWGDKDILFHHCKKCGCITHYSSNTPDSDRVAVNYRMFDPAIIKLLPIRLFDGADSWTVIEKE